MLNRPAPANIAANTDPEGAATDSVKVPNVDIPLESPATLRPISPAHTCDGADVSPPLNWSNIPANTAEIDLFIVHSDPGTGKIFADWGVGVWPALRKISTGRLPSGAIVGRNGFGKITYSICPSKGLSRQYIVVVLALAHKIPAKTGFAITALRARAENSAQSEGLLSFYYRRT